jgi:hypothetical protein
VPFEKLLPMGAVIPTHSLPTDAARVNFLRVSVSVPIFRGSRRTVSAYPAFGRILCARCRSFCSPRFEAGDELMKTPVERSVPNLSARIAAPARRES